MNTWINEKVVPRVMKFVATRPIVSLKNGMIYSIPFIIIGSVFLILGNLPVQSWADWVESSGLKVFFGQAYNASFKLTAMIAALGIAYTWVKDEGYEGMPAALTSLISFILLMNQSVVAPESQEVVAKALNMETLGGKGMVAAIIIGLLTGWIYTYFLKKKITIKLPDSVPANVANSFTALIPSFVIISGSLVVFILFEIFGHTTFVDFIYSTIQIPLQGVTDSYGGVLAISLLVPGLWLFGVHGAAIIYGVMLPILTANSNANAELAQQGQLGLEHGGRIVTLAMMDNIIDLTGSGFTIGIVVFMLFFAKSTQMKALGRIEAVPAIFNINEPILFGLPVVMNPLIAVPFVLVPFLAGTLTYFGQLWGLLPLFNGVVVPWTTPAVISGYLIGGWEMAVWQAILLVISVLVYFPFMKKQDSILYKQEHSA